MSLQQEIADMVEENKRLTIAVEDLLEDRCKRIECFNGLHADAEELQRENDVLREQLDYIGRKEAHGCGDALCAECDKPPTGEQT